MTRKPDDLDRLPSDPSDADETRIATEPTVADDATRTTAGTSAPLPASVPASIGPYRILGKLGEGGMGVVFEAEQKNPRRTVALKVVRGGEFVDEARASSRTGS